MTASARPEDLQHHVLVVGGGISGLATAVGLHEAGISVHLLEARDRLGGRIESVQVAGGPADLGATWFWEGERRVHALVAALGLTTHPQWRSGDGIFWGPDGPERLIGNPLDAPALRFSGGAAELIRGLAAGLPADAITLNAPVTRISRGAHGVEVRFGDVRLNSDKVVVALPPALTFSTGVLAAEDFDAPLPALAAATPVWMAGAIKAVAVYETAFWRTEGFSGAAICHGGPLHEIHDMSGPDGSPALLFGFGASDGDGGLGEAAVIDQLAALFGDKARAASEIVIRDWGQETFTAPRTRPANPRYELFGHPLLAQPAWDGRLFFASTETATVAPGHIEGALAAAERTIRSVSTAAG